MAKQTIPTLIEKQVKEQPEATVLIGLEEKPANYRQLFEQIQDTVSYLNAIGIRRNDPVAIVLPNGPLMAAVFLSVSCGATSAPLNPSYTSAEFEFYLSDLDASALLVLNDSNSPAIGVAENLGIPIINLSLKTDNAEGLFELVSDQPLKDFSAPDFSRMSDTALILHTSGTTSRPKMVPLTQKNLCTSADNIRNTLRLVPTDRCLNIMPLFHIHGLMAAVMASITAGASIACMPGLYATKFFQWMDTFHPTWYTAVPTLHQAIIKRAVANMDIVKQSKIRFIRSSSSSLLPSMMAEMEKIFGVPVIEAYGMTEASHQMACNPLPPGKRKPGSVGQPAGPEIAIMEENQSEIQSKKMLGEVVIRGDNVTLGYMNNPEANAKSFTNGWFRTGDQGYLDEDGYLFLTDRLKEIINRGGEKISPREVDEVLLEHPGVIQALTFSVPDERLGEDIAAVVVLDNSGVSENELKLHAASKLALHKVPGRILIRDEIPKGPTGKLQRIGLAEKLLLGDELTPKLKEKSQYTPPSTDTEKKICAIWEKILDLPKVGIHNRFLDIGGDSMLATLIHVEIEEVFGMEVPLVEVFGATTVSEQARIVKRKLH